MRDAAQHVAAQELAVDVERASRASRSCRCGPLSQLQERGPAALQLRSIAGPGSRAQPRKRAQYSRRHLRWEIHAAHQALEARVGPQVIEAGIDLQQNHPLRLLLVCSL